jgi:hypothetical protein
VALIVVPRYTYAQATLAGAPIAVRSTRIDAGFAKGYLEATIDTPVEPTAGTYNDPVEIACGAYPIGGSRPDEIHFRGYLKQWDRTMYPTGIRLTCKGYMYRMVETFPPTLTVGDPYTFVPGSLGYDLAGPSYADANGIVLNTGATAEGMIQFLMQTSKMNFDPARIIGNQRRLGLIASDWDVRAQSPLGPFVWSGNRSAYQMMQALDEISVLSEGPGGAYFGRCFRSYEMMGGTPVRWAIGARPFTEALATFTQGVDIEEASGTRSILEAKNWALATGYHFRTWPGPVFFVRQGENPFMPPDQINPVTVNNQMIEWSYESEIVNGHGVSAEAVAGFAYLQYNRELVRVRMKTPLATFIGPGATLAVLIPKVGVTEPLWVESVSRSWDRGKFWQEFSLIGGGLQTEEMGGPPPGSANPSA